MNNCYQIWFNNGSSILRNAKNEQEAASKGAEYLDDFGVDKALDFVERIDCVGVMLPAREKTMSRQKTIAVDDLRNRVNELLLDDIKPACKAVCCQLLEDVLYDTGNYYGFNWPTLTAAEAKDVRLGDPDFWTRRYLGS